LREIYEAINHKYALNYVTGNLQNILDDRFIIKLAQVINKNIHEIDSFRNTDVYVRGAEHIPPKKSLFKIVCFIY
jgi:hypothetical protein